MVGVAPAQRAELLFGLVELEVVKVVHRPVQLHLNVGVEQQPLLGVDGSRCYIHVVQGHFGHGRQRVGHGRRRRGLRLRPARRGQQQQGHPHHPQQIQRP